MCFYIILKCKRIGAPIQKSVILTDYDMDRAVKNFTKIWSDSDVVKLNGSDMDQDRSDPDPVHWQPYLEVISFEQYDC